MNLIKHLLNDSKYSEFIRFCIVGGLCTGLDAAIFYIVIQFAAYQVALCSGYIISLVLNYFLTVYWTFNVGAGAKNALGIVGAHLFNLFVVRFGLMWLFVDLLCLSDKIAYVPTLLISVVTNFVIVRYAVRKFKNNN